MTKHRPAPGLTKAQYAAALAREQAARAKPGDILSALAADCAKEMLRPDDVTLARVRAALPAGGSRADSSIKRAILLRVRAGELEPVPKCYDAETGRYVTAYRPPLPARRLPHPQMMRCPKCASHIPRSPAVCPNCGADTRKRKV